jgi:acetyltransferase-like isoleucine patch superfamily enzyme
MFIYRSPDGHRCLSFSIQQGSPMTLPPGLALAAGTVAAIQPTSRFELPCFIQAKLRPGHRIDVGAFTGIFGGIIGSTRIGRYCSFAPACIIAQDEHPIDWLSSSMLQYVDDVHGWRSHIEAEGGRFAAPLRRFSSNRPVEIGNDVWLGYGVFIRGGVRICDGAIVAANSVVVKDVPAYTIVGGNPARPIRPRFPAAIVERLLALRWWNYEVHRLAALDFSDIEGALGVIEDAVAAGTLTSMAPRTLTAAELCADEPVPRRA